MPLNYCQAAPEQGKGKSFRKVFVRFRVISASSAPPGTKDLLKVSAFCSCTNFPGVSCPAGLPSNSEK
jgi:hypothetical protein